MRSVGPLWIAHCNTIALDGAGEPESRVQIEIFASMYRAS
jgi:hypothetical protein